MTENTSHRFINRLDTIEKNRTSEFENRPIEIIQTESQRKKRVRKIKNISSKRRGMISNNLIDMYLQYQKDRR